MEKQNIFYLRNSEIDKAKWDKCIQESPNGIIYSRSFFLDAMSRHWDALVMNDYEMVMPLTWNKKYGIHYLYQPPFIRFSGIFGNIKDELVDLFLQAIPKHFKYWDIDIKENILDPQKIILKDIQFKKRRNFLLDLNRKYSEINKEYKRLATRMLKKSIENNIEIITNCEPAEVINFYKKNYKLKQQNISSEDYERLADTTSFAFKNGNAVTYLAKKAGKVIAAYMILKDEKFIYSLIGGSNEAGKECGAFYLLTDAAIKDHAENSRTFRFEGSDIKGIASFNSQFNPVPIDYYHLKLNQLPWPAKLLKR